MRDFPEGFSARDFPEGFFGVGFSGGKFQNPKNSPKSSFLFSECDPSQGHFFVFFIAIYT